VAWGVFEFFASCDSEGRLDRFVNHVLHQAIDDLDTNGEVTCMNFGFKSDDQPKTDHPAESEPERHCLQMHHKIATAAGDSTGLNVLEVGSGRGGGSAHTKRCLRPARMTGLDCASQAIDFCATKHPDVVFVHGDAEDLPFEDEEFDFVINVESSHCYKHFTPVSGAGPPRLETGRAFQLGRFSKSECPPGSAARL